MHQMRKICSVLQTGRVGGQRENVDDWAVMHVGLQPLAAVEWEWLLAEESSGLKNEVDIRYWVSSSC